MPDPQVSISRTLLFIPNIVDYLRIILLIGATFYCNSRPVSCLVLYVLSACLDGIDGCLARKFNQVSAFGTWLDVVVDNCGRGMLWCQVSQFGFVVTSLEWITFACNHTLGDQWKRKATGPRFVNEVMSNNFRTPLGLLAVGSLNVLPVWLYCLQKNLLVTISSIPTFALLIATAVLLIGRALCAAVEVWCIYVHVIELCSVSKTQARLRTPEGSMPCY